VDKNSKKPRNRFIFLIRGPGHQLWPQPNHAGAVITGRREWFCIGIAIRKILLPALKGSKKCYCNRLQSEFVLLH